MPLVGDTWVEGVAEVKDEVKRYFKDMYSDSGWQTPTLDGINFKSLSTDDNSFLSAPFTLDEIEQAVSSCDGEKSPGPDGFNYTFIKKFWGTIKDEVGMLVQEFYHRFELPKGVCSSFIALIPKRDNPQKVSDFRPISLIGVVHKLISKLLAARLKRVIGSLISTSQSAFIAERQTLDGVLAISEVVDLAKKSGDDCIIFKVDFEKAYDSVNWGLLKYVMRRMGFDEKWMRWMGACIFKGHVSVLVNGSPMEEVLLQKGLRQGDPLAPFLFLLVAEGLSRMMSRVVELGLFSGFSFQQTKTISLLQYADDTIMVGKATYQNLWALKAVLRGFELVSGLKVNFHKSCIYGVNVGSEFLLAAGNFLSCSTGNIPFTYLGLPIGANPRKASTW